MRVCCFFVHFTFNLASCVVLVKLIEMAPATTRHSVVQQATDLVGTRPGSVEVL